MPSASDNVSGLTGFETERTRRPNGSNLHGPITTALSDTAAVTIANAEHAPHEQPSAAANRLPLPQEHRTGGHQQRDGESGKQLPFGALEDIEMSPEPQGARTVQKRREIGAEVSNASEVAGESEGRMNGSIVQQERQHRQRCDGPRDADGGEGLWA
jgi:hypothetical protein